MNILILGSGGREHALAWKLAQSSKVGRIFIGPGNASTATAGTNLPLDPGDFEGIKKAVLDNNVKMLVVGPEEFRLWLVLVIFSEDYQLKNIPVIGPSQSAARLEEARILPRIS